MMADYCIRVTANEGQIRLWAAISTELCEEARRRHDLYPTAAAALGRALTAGAIIGLNLKGQDILTLRINGNGPLGGIVVTANARGEVRGYVGNPHTHLPAKAPGKLDVGGAVGREGLLHICKDMGLKEPYTGSVPLVNGEIGEDLTRYFAESEQTPSAVALGVLVETDNRVRAAGGFMVQLMPGATDECAERLEENINRLPPVSRMVDEGLTPEDIAEEILAGMDYQVLEAVPLKFLCPCSRERSEQILAGMGPKELASMLREQGAAELVCSFCGTRHCFTESQLKDMIAGIATADPQ